MVRRQPRQVVLQDPISKNTSTKKTSKGGGEGAGGVAQSIGPEFKLQYHKIKKYIVLVVGTEGRVGSRLSL
jgi:hypothetical protein